MLAVKKNACGFYLPQQQWKVKNNVGYYLSCYQDITYKYHQQASWFPTFTQDDTSALGATPDMFFAAPPVAFVMLCF
jgi:hypothetical protein